MQEYAAVVPVKPPARGKSRLGGLSGVPDDRRHALAEAFALDTISACLATPGVARVVVATDDPGFADRVVALGASTVPDGDARGLNPVLRQATAEAARRWPSLRPVAICADLPALRVIDLSAALAEAFALDTVSACLVTPGVARVVVATDDRGFADRVVALGASTVPDGDARGLNPVLRQATAEAARRWPSLRPVAICADLPALRVTDLRAALDEAGAVDGPAYVADHTGTGTTLYTAASELFAPCFGPGSARAHRDGGAVALAGVLPTLRRDVDDVRDLEAAATLGLGAATSAAWSARL